MRILGNYYPEGLIIHTLTIGTIIEAVLEILRLENHLKETPIPVRLGKLSCINRAYLLLLNVQVLQRLGYGDNPIGLSRFF